MREDQTVEYVVIVHPAGLVDKKGLGYWTEVIDLPICFSEGPTSEAAIENTRKAIAEWLSSQEPPSTKFELDIFMAL